MAPNTHYTSTINSMCSQIVITFVNISSDNNTLKIMLVAQGPTNFIGRMMKVKSQIPLDKPLATSQGMPA